MSKLIQFPEVLIIDDDLIILDVLKTAIEITEIFDHIHTSTNIKNAQELLMNKDLGLIIVDQYLPDGKGLKLIEEMRKGQFQKNSQTPVLFTTGHPSDELVEQLKAISNLKYLPKPYVMEGLVEDILEMLQLK